MADIRDALIAVDGTKEGEVKTKKIKKQKKKATEGQTSESFL